MVIKKITLTSMSITASFLLLCLFVYSAQLQAVQAWQASVNRSNLSINETFTLTLEAKNLKSNQQPDFSTLNKDFMVLNRSTAKSFKFYNGTSTWTQQWVFVLKPKQEGTLVIPALKLEQYTTNPIEVKVTKENHTSHEKGKKALFLQSSIDSKNVYLHAQLLYTLKLYFQPSAKVSQYKFSDFKIPSAIVKKVGNFISYRSQVNGKSYQVIEKKFAIFPQKKGDLYLPSQSVAIEVMNQQQNGYFVINTPEIFTVKSKDFKVNVKSIPKDYHSTRWLPAKQVTISETWSKNLHQIKVGDAITRTIIIHAQGQIASQLLPITTPSSELVNIYPDQNKQTSEPSAMGLTGSLTQSQAWVAIKPGLLIIPESHYSWFDTKTHVQRFATLPKQVINIEGGTKKPINPDAGNSLKTKKKLTIETNNTNKQSSIPWVYFSFALILFIILLFLLWIMPKYKTKSSPIKDNNRTNTEMDLFYRLKKSCKEDSYNQLMKNFVSWYEKLTNKPYRSFLEALESTGDEDLISQGKALDRLTYNKTTNEKSEFNPNSFLNSCYLVRKKLKTKPINESESSLYPDL